MNLRRVNWVVAGWREEDIEEQPDFGFGKGAWVSCGFGSTEQAIWTGAILLGKKSASQAMEYQKQQLCGVDCQQWELVDGWKMEEDTEMEVELDPTL